MSRALRTFVCYGSKTLELYEGDAIVAGRAARCEIVLDDDLASREHCKVTLEVGKVYVRDMGSRNGVLVNGMPVDGRHELHHGDQVTAGRSAITILRQGREPRLRTSSAQPVYPDYDQDSDQVTGAGNLVDLLDGAARRALSEGDLMVAERTTLNLFGLLRRAARGREVRADEVAGAARLAIDLAEQTGDPGWLGRILELHVAAGHLVGAPTAGRFVDLSSRLGPPDRAVQEYFAMAEERGSVNEVAQLCRTLSPSE